MRLVEINARDVLVIWPMVQDWISAATDKTAGHWTAGDVLERCQDGRCTLWVITDDKKAFGAVATELEDGPRRRIGRIAVLGGRKFKLWRHLIAQLEQWARNHGAQEMQILGRAAWKRVLAADGYAERAVLIGKSL